MSIEIKVPALPESVADALLSTWHKQVGDHVEEGENLVDLETDKVMLEVPATASGTIKEIKVEEGTDVTAGTVLAIIEAGSAPAAKAEEAPKAEAQAAQAANEDDEVGMSPTVRRLVEENKLDITKIPATGKNGRHLKEDIENFLKNGGAKAAPAAKAASVAAMPVGERVEKRVPMTRLRARIAERLLDATNTTAMLTTFNEINMEAVINMRKKYQDRFIKTHDVKLGFMSFFVKATVEALKKYPAVNASIDGNDIVYHGYFDIGIAVSSPRGLVVPIIRNADQLSLADIEKQIIEYATKAKEGTLTIEEMTGGTFTITNGGVFGSMLSTPIINPPQSGILGMHNTYERPIVKDGQIVAAPMMYVAHSYDHRIIDGAEAVGFLVSIKNDLEDPARMILEI